MKCVRTVCNEDFSPLPSLVRTSLTPAKYVGMKDNSPKIHLDNDGFLVQLHFCNMYLTIGNNSLTERHVYVNDGFIDINGHVCLSSLLLEEGEYNARPSYFHTKGFDMSLVFLADFPIE